MSTEDCAPLARWGRWSVRALAVVAGAASVLSMAPFFLWPVLFLTLPVLVLLIDDAVRRGPRRPWASVATIAWFYGFGYFLAGLFWIGEAFLVEADKFAALMPFAVVLMPAGLAMFWAAAAAGASAFWRPGWSRILTLTVALSASEWLRGHIFTGFPWNVLGYALTAPDAMMQSASVLGIYGLTVVAIPVFAAPLVLWVDDRGSRTALVAALGSAAVLAGIAGWGALRLMAAQTASAQPSVMVRLVQPSIPQREKWQPEFQRRNFERHLELTRRGWPISQPSSSAAVLIVWPEAAMPFLPLDTPAALSALGAAIPDGAHLVAGLLRVEPLAEPRANRVRRVLNSLAAFTSAGDPVAMYDKTHLVPFGEYLPFQSTLEAIGLEQITRIRGGFDTGVIPRPLLRIPGIPPMAPLICYEAIFPATVVQSSERPAALLNLTNDGWFGNTTGPRQHLHQTRVRAVEEGLPLIRSANNGISAVIDAYGRIVARMELDEVGIRDVALPATIAPTIYGRMADLTFLLLMTATVVVGWLTRDRH